MSLEGEIVYAIHDFEATVEDEISLKTGEEIIVIEKDELYNDGWWQGKNSRGEIGLFPMNFISYKDPKVNNSTLDRYANLLNEPEDVQLLQQPTNLGGRLSDPMNEQNSPPDSINKNYDEDYLLNNDSRETSNYSPLVPALSLVPNDKNSIENNNTHDNNNNNTNLTRWNSSKIQSGNNHYENEGHKRTLTSNMPLTPNRSEFRHSVKLDNNDDLLEWPHPETWSVDEVITWLDRMGFQSVIGLFKENQINGKELIKLDLNTLKDIGILAFGKRFNLNNAINSLKVKYGINLNNINNNQDLNEVKEHNNNSQNNNNNNNQSNNNSKIVNDEQIYPVEERNPNNLEKSIQNLNINTNITNYEEVVKTHSHIEKWLQQTPDFDYDHDLLKEAGIPPQEISSLSNQGVFHSQEYSDEDDNEELDQTSPTISSVNSPPNHNPMPPSMKAVNNNENDTNIRDQQKVHLKKQVSFSQEKPEVIGTSELIPSDDEESMGAKLSKTFSLSASNLKGDKRKVPAPKHSKYQDDLPMTSNALTNGETKTTHTYVADPYSPPSSDTNNNAPTISVQGNLKKQEGAIKLWKTRYCVLSGTSLKIWDSYKLKKLKMAIDLRGFKPVLDPSLNPGKYCFKLVHPQQKSHFFCSDEPEEIRAWMKALMKMSIDRDVNAPVVTSCTVNTVPLHVARKLAPRPPSAMYSNSNELEEENSSKSNNQQPSFGLTG